MRASWLDAAREWAKSMSNVHRPDGRTNVFLFATARGGSTWLMELIWTQPGFKYCADPLDVRRPAVRRRLGLSSWTELHTPECFEKIAAHIRGICSGRVRYGNPNPLRLYYRPFTRRVVIKLATGGEEYLGWFRDECNGRVLLLLRHPIPVSLSRRLLPQLEAFVESPYAEHLRPEERRVARRVIRSGSLLEKGVLDWCLHNAVPLRAAGRDWTFVTYEQLVLDPEPAILELARRLDLPAPARMRRRLATPSAVKYKSTPETRRLLESGTPEDRARLVDAWRSQVRAAEAEGAMALLPQFGIDAYTHDGPLPAERYWIK